LEQLRANTLGLRAARPLDGTPSRHPRGEESVLCSTALLRRSPISADFGARQGRWVSGTGAQAHAGARARAARVRRVDDRWGMRRVGLIGWLKVGGGGTAVYACIGNMFMVFVVCPQ